MDADSSDTIPHGDPLALFDAWFAEARASEPNDANAMALATATPDGAPSVRMVLLKEPRRRRLRVLHQRPEPQGRGNPRQSAGRAAVPLEVAAPPGAHRRAADAKSIAATADAYFASRAPAIRSSARWPRDQSAPARCPRDVPRAGRRRCARRLRRRRGAAAAALDRLPARRRETIEFWHRPRRTASTNAGGSSRDGDGGWTSTLLYP